MNRRSGNHNPFLAKAVADHAPQPKHAKPAPPAAVEFEDGETLKWSEAKAALTQRMEKLAERVMSHRYDSLEDLKHDQAMHQVLRMLRDDPKTFLKPRRDGVQS